MNNHLVKRMNTIGKVGKIITIVVIVLAIISTIAMAGVAVVVSALPKDTISADVAAQVDVMLSDEVFKDVNDTIVKEVNNNSKETIDAGVAQVDIKAESIKDNAAIRVNADKIHLESGMLSPAIWIAVFNCIAFVVCAFFFMGLMSELSAAPSPFTEGVVKKMKFFAIAILAASIATSIANSLISLILTAGHAYTFNFNFGSIITAVIIFVLAVVFRYGAQLQKESDETL